MSEFVDIEDYLCRHKKGEGATIGESYINIDKGSVTLDGQFCAEELRQIAAALEAQH